MVHSMCCPPPPLSAAGCVEAPEQAATGARQPEGGEGEEAESVE